MLLRHENLRRLVALALAATIGVSSSSATAAPRRRVVDGIVAVVDESCITRSELARYAAPHEARVARELAGKPAERIQATARVRKEALRALVDQRLFEKEARRRAVEVTEGEVAAVIASLAKQNGLSVPDLMAVAKAEGLDDTRYRAELRAQLLEGKLVQLDIIEAKVDLNGMTDDQRTMRIAALREAFAAKLRERAFIEIRL